MVSSLPNKPCTGRSARSVITRSQERKMANFKFIWVLMYSSMSALSLVSALTPSPVPCTSCTEDAACLAVLLRKSLHSSWEADAKECNPSKKSVTRFSISDKDSAAASSLQQVALRLRFAGHATRHMRRTYHRLEQTPESPCWSRPGQQTRRPSASYADGRFGTSRSMSWLLKPCLLHNDGFGGGDSQAGHGGGGGSPSISTQLAVVI